MDRTLFFDGMDVLEEDLDNVEDTKVAAIQRTRTDIATQVGIMFGLTVTNPIAYQLSVAAGVAYDSNGEALIRVTPQTIVVTGGDVGFYLVIQHTQTDGTPVEHPITGILNQTRRVDGTALAMTAVPAATDVVLAQLTALSGGGTATLDVDQDPDGPRVYWSARIANNQITDEMLVQTDGVIVHINSFGTGIVSPTNPHGLSPADIGVVSEATPHQQKEHAVGIEPSSGTGALAVVINSLPAPDQAIITQLGVGDSVQIDGVRITDTPGVSPTTLTFVSAPVNPALYEVYVNSAAIVTAYKRAEYTAVKNITGVQVVDYSANHGVGTFNLSFTFTFKQLSWDGGPLVTLSTITDGFYTLQRGTDTRQTILIWSDASTLPGANQIDAIAVAAAIEGPNAFILANLPWSGSASGFLGYGDHSASGLAWDKRTRGNLAQEDLTDKALIELIYNYFSETRADGIVTGGTATNGGGFILNIATGIGYVCGRRFEWAAQPKTLVNGINYVWLDYNGVIQSSLVSPFSWGFDPQGIEGGQSPVTRVVGRPFQPLGRGCPLAKVTVSAGVITLINNNVKVPYTFVTDTKQYYWEYLFQGGDLATVWELGTDNVYSTEGNDFLGFWDGFTGSNSGGTTGLARNDTETASGAARIGFPEATPSLGYVAWDFVAGAPSGGSVEKACRALVRGAREPAYVNLTPNNCTAFSGGTPWVFNGSYWTLASGGNILRIWIPPESFSVDGPTGSDNLILDGRLYYRGGPVNTLTASLRSYTYATGVVSAALDTCQFTVGATDKTVDFGGIERTWNTSGLSYVIDLEPDAGDAFRFYGGRLTWVCSPSSVP